MFHYDLILSDGAQLGADIFSMPILDSRMYVFHFGDELLIIDPVLIDEADEPALQSICEDASRATVLVTHSHYDHIAGFNHLRELLPVTLHATPLCDKKMSDSHQNLAAYSLALVMGKTEERQRYCEECFDFDYACHADEIYEDTLILDIRRDSADHRITVRDTGSDDEPYLYLRTVATPGHSDCSQCIELRLYNGHLLAVFTGDSLVNGHDVITRFPTGSSHIFRDATEPYLFDLPDDVIILPGHGDPAPMRDMKQWLYNRGTSPRP